MIKTFSHKGLERYFYEGSKRGIQPNQAQKLGDILDRLQASETIQDMDFPGSGLHSLKGELKNVWAVRVSGNWRVTFRFHEGHAFSVDYVDYH